MRRILNALRLAPLLLLALSGCVTPVSEYVPRLQDARSLEPLRTSDPAVIRQRFGDLGLAAGHFFGYRSSRVVSVLTYQWVVEGAAMWEKTSKCADYLIGDASCDEWTKLIYFSQALDALVFQDGREAYAIGKVQPNGSVLVKRPGYGSATYSFNAATSELKMDTLLGGDAAQSLNDEQLAAIREEQAHFLANLGKKSAENSAFWANASAAFLAGAQAYAADQQQQLAQEQQRQYEANVRAAQAAEQARARAEAAQRARQASYHAAQRANASKAEAQPTIKPLPKPAQVATARRLQQPARSTAQSEPPSVQRVAAAAPVAPVSRSTQPEPKPETVAKANKPELFPYPEAVVVCTVPDAKGHFSCDDPLHEGEPGGPNGLKQDRTPESKVASIRNDVCKGAHRLRSSTHMVWGCGFAATGVSPYMDRVGPGVDVHGRRTYYCPKEYPFNCTNTRP